MAEIKKKIYFENLDGLRFICFLSVFLFHSFHTNYTYIKDSPTYIFAKFRLFGNGDLGVNFFFVLSGFLITYLLIKEREIYSNINVLYFWKRRILRIWPLFYFCVFFGFIVFPFLKSKFGQLPNETADPVYYITFLNNFDVIRKGLPDASVLGVLWSVAVEEQFYLVWPVLLFIVPSKYYLHLFIFIIVSSIFFRFMFNNSGGEMFIEYSTFSCAGDLAMGALGALVIQREGVHLKVVELKRNVIVLIYTSLFFIFFFRKEVYQNLYFLKPLERTFISLLFLIIILEQSFATHSLFKMKDFKWISKLGVITYGLYCLHFIGILVTTTVVGELGYNTLLWQVIFLETSFALLVSIIIAAISYRYYELPFLKLKNRYSRIVKD